MPAVRHLIPCASLCLILISASCDAEELSAEDLARVHLKRVQLYSGWEFDYESTLVTADGKSLGLQNVMVLDATDETIHRLVITYREKSDESNSADPSLLQRFAGWNGKEYREYERKESLKGQRLQGLIYANERGSHAYHQNRFDAFLTSGPHGIPQYADASGKIFDKHPFKFRVVGRGERLGVPTLQLEAKTGNEMLAEAEISDTAEHLVLRQVIYHDNQPVLKCEVTSLGRFEGTLYPKSGQLAQEQVGGIGSLAYRFEVENVSKTARTKDDWFPHWPPGTGVIDHTNGALQTVIPKD
ncbi:hypothetical protein Mal15_01300 [Stieleria maiorica]|uniref:Uncharacterized protein n=1 Tax=Stieleria maiorica TaxID=2795974 RepID=A0A5B9M968_9BACT|nr:hypothetical protein [Stieleria maiorica]QEF96104.1 hypothetical protein Mal15_01300 [Stieleria maiorica]